MHFIHGLGFSENVVCVCVWVCGCGCLFVLALTPLIEDYVDIQQHSEFHVEYDFTFRVDYVEMQKHIEFDIDSDGTVSIEEARVSVR